MMTSADLSPLRDRLVAAMPHYTYEMGELENSDTGACYPALMMETADRVRGRAWRLTIIIIDGEVNFFLHIHGESQDLTTKGAHWFSKACADLDEVFAGVHACWTGDVSS